MLLADMQSECGGPAFLGWLESIAEHRIETYYLHETWNAK